MSTDDELINRNMLKLASGGIGPIREGRQSSTTRIGIRRYTLGPALLIEGRSKQLRIFITRLEAILFGELASRHARTEGFDSVLKLMGKIRRHYPHVRLEDELTYVRFEIIEQAPIESIEGGHRGRHAG
jgi:hypothetical protein